MELELEHRIDGLLNQIRFAYLVDPALSAKSIAQLIDQLYKAIAQYRMKPVDPSPSPLGSSVVPRIAASRRSGPDITDDRDTLTFNARAVGLECLRLWQPVAEMKGIEFSATTRLQDPQGPIAILNAVRHTLFCLIGNAIKFTHGGTIELRLRAANDGSTLRFEVIDSGPGIPAEQRRQLVRHFRFPPDHVVDGIQSIRADLILATHLVRSVNGTIGHLDNPKGGSNFWIEVPACSHCKPPEADDNAGLVLNLRSNTSKCQRRPCVLVVDDDQLQRDLTTAILVTAGYEVVCAATGQAAVQAVEQKNFDVVVMDLNMPSLDGAQATQQIRSLKSERRFVPVLGLTVRDGPKYIQKCQNAGMNAHLAKPINPAKLKVAVALAVHSRPSGQQVGWFGNEAAN